MPGLSAAELLRLWEDARASDRHTRARMLLRAADPELGDAPTLGARNEALLELRRATFGDRIECFYACGACGERLEFEVTASGMLAALPPAGPSVLEVGEWAIEFRALTAEDAAFAAATGDIEAARQRLVERSVVLALRDGDEVAARELPEEIVELLAAALAAADPAADLAFALECPQCGAREEALLDVPEFFWRELSVQARRLLAQVDALARAYAWPEREILAMSSTRRQAYLELAAG